MDTRTLTLLLGLAAAVLAVAAWARSRRTLRRRKKPSGSGFAWALLFLSSGRMPPPPPQSQIEQEAGERKNRQMGRSTDTTSGSSFQLKMTDRSGEIEYREQEKQLLIPCEMSGVPRYELLLAPLNLTSWTSPGEPIDALKQREILAALRQWLGSQALRTDIDLPAQNSLSEARCQWSGCQQRQLADSAYCEEHYDAMLLC